MTQKKCAHIQYFLGDKILIYYKNDESMFWLRTEKEYWIPDDGDIDVLEGGSAWIDNDTDTTILDFPVQSEDKLKLLKNEFLQELNWPLHYKKSDFYVRLSDCEKYEPTTLYNDNDQDDLQTDLILNPECFINDYTFSFKLNNYTFIRKEEETGNLYYLQFSHYTKEDIENDRFGWIKAAREYYSHPSYEKLHSLLNGFVKESYGDVWINDEHNTLVLGPINRQHPEIIDNYYHDRLVEYRETYPVWNQSKYYIEIESRRIKNPFDYKVSYIYLLERYMG